MENKAILILTAITAGGAFLAAVGAWINTIVASKARTQQLINDLLDYRYEKAMFRAMRSLRDWYNRHKGNDRALAEEYKSIRDTTSEGKELDEHRKYLFTYFRKIKDLKEARLIKKKNIKGLVNSSDLSMFLHIIAPMGRVIKPDLIEIDPVDPRGKKKQDIFDYFEEIYWKYYRPK